MSQCFPAAAKSVFSPAYFRFRFAQSYKNYPIQLSGVVVILLILVVALGLTLGIQERSALLAREKTRLSAAHSQSVSASANSWGVVALPPLHASELVKTFSAIAKDSTLPIDEVVYSVDNIAVVPYLRYRITLTTKAGYSQTRKFVAILSSEMPNVTLDNVRCTRADAATSDLGCELVFSAFFSRAGHG